MAMISVDTVHILCALGSTLPSLQCAPWVMRPGRGTDHTILSSAEVIGLYIHSPYIASWRTRGQLGLYFFQNKRQRTYTFYA
jgi:hypothetical protein